MEEDYVALLLSRCLVGLGLGGGPVLLLWFLDFVPAPKRGTRMVISQAFWTIGTIAEAALAWIHIAKLNGNRLPTGVLFTDHEIELQKQSLPEGGGNLRSQYEDEDEDVNHPPLRWKDFDMGIFRSLSVLSPKLVRSTLLLWMVFFGNGFSYYGLVLLTTELNKGNDNCNSTDRQSHKSGSVNYKDVFTTSFEDLPGLILAALTVDTFGRKLSIALTFLICLVVLLPLVVHQRPALTTALLFGARICITGTFTVVYIYAPEIYPTSVRATGVGGASSMGRIGGMISPLVAVSLVQGCHQTAADFFVCAVFVSGICVSLFPRETKGLPGFDG